MRHAEADSELLPHSMEIRGVTHCSVRWRGRTSAADGWLRAADALPHCQEKGAGYDAAARPRRRSARRGGHGPSAAAAPFKLAVAPGPFRGLLRVLRLGWTP